MKTKNFTTFLIGLLVLQIGFIKAQDANSLSFNGSDNYVELSGLPLNDIGTGDFTFEIWIKGDESMQTAHPMIFSNRDENAFGGGVVLFFHAIWGDSQHKMLTFQVDANNWFFIDNGEFNGSILDNTCHHIALVRKGLVLSYYIDGNQIGERIFSTISDISNDHPLWIGKDRAANNTFNGNISQFRIWNIARTETEINELMDYSIVNEMPGLIANLEMTEGEGQVVADNTNNYSGLLGGADAAEDNDPSWSNEGCAVAIPVSTNELASTAISLYPNPTSGLVTITSTTEEPLFISIVDVAGKEVASKKNYTSTVVLDMTDFVSGIYYVQLISAGESLTKKVVKF